MTDSSPNRAFDVLIVGGGISGLSLSYCLKRRGISSLLFERSSRLGGNIRTAEHDGFLYDIGPDSFVRAKPEAEALCRELGLGRSLISPLAEGRRVYVALGGKLHPIPEGLSLGVPTRARALALSELLSDLGKARAFLEPFMFGAKSVEEESITQFLTRRMGREMAERIAAPLLAGMFAGDPDQLSMTAAFPQLVELEQSHGSLFFGLRAPRVRGVPQPLSPKERAMHLWGALVEPPKHLPSPFLSLERGLGQLVEALTDELQVAEGSHDSPRGLSCARLEESVEQILISNGRAIGVKLLSGETVLAESVVLAGPPWSAAEMLKASEPSLAAQLGRVRGAPTATVFFGFEREKGGEFLTGSGFIVPPGEGEILASTWVDQKWAGRAPPGANLVRAFVGGARGVGPNVMSASDFEIEWAARRELERLMGPLGRLRFSRVYRYSHGTPQPELGHRTRIQEILERTSQLRGLSLIGPGYDGVGIPDCIRAAQDLATTIADGSSTSFHAP